MRDMERCGDFIATHINDDTHRLLLSAHRYPDIDVPIVVEQIEARRQIKSKLPEWFANMKLWMGGRLPAEQCSSELTARYKRGLVLGKSLCDLTGGMGVDCYYMSRGLVTATYVERQTKLCEAARHNFFVLHADNVHVVEAEAETMIGQAVADTIYIDPARRAADGRRVFDLRECEPDVVSLMPQLTSGCRRLIIKVSPMADLTRLVQQVQEVTEIHVVAVRNECKELLLVVDAGERSRQPEQLRIVCIDFQASRDIRLEYVWHDEAEAQPSYAENILRYLYEPDVTLLKAGAFRLASSRFGVQKLDTNSHLYTDNVLKHDFPGRIYEVVQTLPFASRVLRTIRKSIPCANISARNFPLTADQMRARSGIKEGGAEHLFATTLRSMGPCLVHCRRICMLIVWMGLMCAKLGAERRMPEPMLEEWLSSVQEQPLAMWAQGSRFVCLDSTLALVLQPEKVGGAHSRFRRGDLWLFDGIVEEENWLGQQVLQLRFLSPEAIPYRFEMGAKNEVMRQSDYKPQIPALYPYSVITAVDSLLRAHVLYILIDDERIHSADTALEKLSARKYCPVVVDSVSYGTDRAPLKVSYHLQQDDAQRAYVLSALPGTAQAAAATPLHKFFSTVNPYLHYPDIAPDLWALICIGEIRRGMSMEEVRLSLGRPVRTESFATRQGVVQFWYYRNGMALRFSDGRLLGTAVQP